MRHPRNITSGLQLTVLVCLLALIIGCGDESSVTPTDDAGADATNAESPEGGEQDTVEDNDGSGIPDIPLSEDPYWAEIEIGGEGIWASVSTYQDADGNPNYILTGANGQVALFDGYNTEFIDTETNETIRGAWIGADGAMVIAGDNGFVRHWDPETSKWKLPSGLPLAGLDHFNCLAGNHPSNIYIGGDNGQFYKWNGSDWIQVLGSNGLSVTTEDISALWISDDGIVFGTAANTIFWGKGVEWQSTQTEKEMSTVYGFSSQDVYAGGGFGNCEQPPCTKYIYHFTAAGWEAQSTPAPAAQGINDIWGPNPETIVAISFKGTVLGLEAENAAMGWQLLTSDSDMSDYIPKSPFSTPDEEEIRTQTLTLDKITGRSESDILIAAKKLITPPGETIAATPGCDGCSCEVCVCAENPECCVDAWSDSCVTACKTLCGGDSAGGEKGLLLHFTRHPLDEEEE